MRRPISVFVVLGLVASVMALTPSRALGHDQTRYDGAGSKGRFDIRSSTLLDEGNDLAVLITTYKRWRASTLTGDRGFWVGFDSKGGSAEDYYVAIFWRQGKLRGNLWEERGDNDQYRKKVRVARPSGSLGNRSVAIFLTTGDIRLQGNLLRWRTVSSYRTSSTCRRICWDVAPNRGMYAHDMDV